MLSRLWAFARHKVSDARNREERATSERRRMSWIFVRACDFLIFLITPVLVWCRMEYPTLAMFSVGGVVSNIFLYVHPENWGFMIQFDEHIFQMGLVQPPTRAPTRSGKWQKGIQQGKPKTKKGGVPPRRFSREKHHFFHVDPPEYLGVWKLSVDNWLFYMWL